MRSAFGAHHLLWMDCLQKVEDGKIKRLLGLMPPGAGKALALDTPIPTPDGWKLMGDLRLGDKVFGSDGKTCDVTWVSPVWRDRPCYKVVTDCGDEIIADQDHEWLISLWGTKYKSRKNQQKLRTTKELATKRNSDHTRSEGPRCKRPMILRGKAIELPEQDLLIDPYVLGAWLGDGSSYHPCITVGRQDFEWLSSELNRLGYEHSVNKNNSCFSLGLLGIRNKFQELRLFDGGESGRVQGFKNKHIPPQYLRASVAQRLALLQGLIDTDGSVRSDGFVEFMNMNANISFGVAELVRSLGAKASVNERNVTFEGRDMGVGYRVLFFLENAARMPRKAKNCRNAERTPHTYIDVSAVQRADTVCIEVNSPNHMFLCGKSMTPTHNSVFSSIIFPTHFMGRFPRHNAIVASYGSELPTKFGRRARSIVKQPIYKRIFGTQLSDESSAADGWVLTNGSEWMAAGILTGITGNRVDLVIWDDLIKGREQADSDVIRNKTWDAYMDDLLTRKKPGAREIGVTTRWHEDDPAGRILPVHYAGETGWVKGRDGNDWYVLCLPAQCEHENDPLGRKIGEYIWPEWFPPDHFKPFKQNSRTWSSLFQQRPAPESGDYFQSDWLKPYGPSEQIKTPSREALRIYGASDYAVSKGKNDYTVHIVVGIDDQHRMYVLDLWRKQAASDEWVEAFCDLVQKWKPIGWAEESGQIASAMGPLIHKRLMERRLYLARKTFPSRKDKEVRAQSIRGRMSMNGLYVPTHEPWYPDFKNELMVFSNGNNDDQVDALSLIGQILDLMMPGEGEKTETEKPKVFSMNSEECTITLTDLFEEHERKRSKKGRSLRIA